MEKYVVILKNKSSDTIDPAMNVRHCDHLRKLALEGTLFLCGPLIGHGGAMQIVEAESKEEAEAIIKKDPFISEGFYLNYDIYLLLEANLENNFLLKAPLLLTFLFLIVITSSSVIP